MLELRIHPWTTFPLRNTANLGWVPWPPENFQEEKHFLEDQWTFLWFMNIILKWNHMSVEYGWFHSFRAKEKYFKEILSQSLRGNSKTVLTKRWWVCGSSNVNFSNKSYVVKMSEVGRKKFPENGQ